MTIYNDQLPRDAPVARDDNVKILSHVEADVSHIPEDQLSRRQGSDGQWYYELNCKIEAVYLSASTTYTLLYNGEFYLIQEACLSLCLTNSCYRPAIQHSDVRVCLMVYTDPVEPVCRN
ncbi:hypothetical protein EDB82DRAFT_515343 [Fusarium venenatum]|uniref:uncharacterized protein n=1 Tax=Fusarium venenatum TaxID=56646 RepID=UPI001D2CEFD9|nr:hypothetical protein EDB82DRAFT_515343 [Fusarium venenatum]